MLLSLAGRLTHNIFDKRLGPAVFTLKTAVSTYAVVLIGTLPVLLFDDSIPEKMTPDDLLSHSIGALIFAPIAENLLMVGMTSLLSSLQLRPLWTVAIIAVAFAWLHSFGAHRQVAAGLCLFATMSYSYLIWVEKPFIYRYLITIGQHFLFNLPGILIFAVYSRQ